jgi:hypothetical protein
MKDYKQQSLQHCQGELSTRDDVIVAVRALFFRALFSAPFFPRRFFAPFSRGLRIFLRNYQIHIK